MHVRGRVFVGLLLLGGLAAGPAGAAKNNFVPDAVRESVPERMIHVIVAQAEIGTDIVPTRVSMVTGGGLLFAMIDAGVDAAKAKKAEVNVQPMRTALIDYDFDSRIRATTDDALAGITWLKARSAELSKDSSTVGMLAALDASPTEQVVFIRYRYGVNPDFSSIVVTADVDVANRTAPAGEDMKKRLNNRNVVYSQVMHSVVSLPNPAKEAEVNAQTWAADNGRAARRALDAAVSRMHESLRYSLGLSAAQAAALNKAERIAVGDYQGRKLEGLTGGVFLYDRPDIVFVQELAP
jgi:hypothetical protein